MSVLLSHIAVASSEIDAVLRKLETLKLKVEAVHEVPTEKVRAAMVPLKISPHFRLEILEPTSKDSPIAKFLEKRPQGGIHHLCFEVKDLKAWELTLEKAGFEVLPPGIRKAARGEALFVHPRSFNGVLVELEEIRV